MTGSALAIGSLDLRNGGHFIAQAATWRTRAITCPTVAQPFTVTGQLRIEGNQMRSKFTHPDGSRLDAWQNFFKVGDNKCKVCVVNVAVPSVL